MSKRWNELGVLHREYGGRTCRVINSKGAKDERCTSGFEQGHHGIFSGEKSKTAKEWRDFLDHPYNYCPSCTSCNISRVGDGSEARWHFFEQQVKRYGMTQIRVWLKTAPAEIQARHEYKRYLARVSERELA